MEDLPKEIFALIYNIILAENLQKKKEGRWMITEVDWRWGK